MPPIKPASAKAKGRRFQQWIRTQLIEAFDLSPADISSRPMGSGGEDLIIGNESRAKFPYSVEAKHRQSFKPLYDAYKQASVNCPEGIEPVFVVKTDKERALVTLSFEHFIELARRK